LPHSNASKSKSKLKKQPKREKKESSKGVRVQIQNVGVCVSFPEFVSWCDRFVAARPSGKIHSIQLSNNFITETQGASYAILCLDVDAERGAQFIRKVHGQTFRATRMSFKPWTHPRSLRRLSLPRHSDWAALRRTHTLSFAPDFPHLRRQPNFKSEFVPKKNARFRGIEFDGAKSVSRLQHRHSLKSLSSTASSESTPSRFPSSVAVVAAVPVPPGFGRSARQSVVKETTAEIGVDDEKQRFERWLVNEARAGEYLGIFKEHGLDAMETMDTQHVNHRVLQDIGVSKIGHRIKILKAIEKCKENTV
jgi:hypothetical protein